jgi:hypothetical protein
MLFAIDSDLGVSISGWLAPDNPSEVPRLIIQADDGDPVEMQANQMRQDILDAGLHGVGQVGFVIDESIVPGLGSAETVELIDATSRICIYARSTSDRFVKKKLFLFDGSLVSNRSIINQINKRFASRHNYVERYGYDTLSNIIYSFGSRSVFLSGRPQYMRHINNLRTGEFIVTALLNDPFEELAERLLVLNLISKSNASDLLAGVTSGLEPAIDFAATIALDDRKALAKAFRALGGEQRQALANPTTRMLACALDEKADRRHVSVALEQLAQMELVGTRAKIAEFAHILGDLVGVELVPNPQVENLRSAAKLAEDLARIPAVVDLLEHDLALYSFAEEAVRNGLT